MLFFFSGELADNFAQADEPIADHPLYQVPDADAAELLAYIERVEREAPRETTRQRKLASYAIQAAAEKILALQPSLESEPYREAKTIDLTRKLKAIDLATPRERKAFADAVRELVALEQSGPEQMELGRQTAAILESTPGDEELAATLYLQLAEKFAHAPNPRLRNRGELLAGAARRLRSVGQPFEISGTTLTGRPWAWSDVQGKVVLVDFWSIYCGPCVAELPALKKLYKQYQPQGFEIVSVNLDEEREEVEAFVKQAKIPWPLLYDDEHGGNHPAANAYGVMHFPTMLLIDRQSRVISIRARGETLEQLLEEQFPASAKPAESAAATNKK